jgi:hypothetical protein
VVVVVILIMVLMPVIVMVMIVTMIVMRMAVVFVTLIMVMIPVIVRFMIFGRSPQRRRQCSGRLRLRASRRKPLPLTQIRRAPTSAISA